MPDVEEGSRGDARMRTAFRAPFQIVLRRRPIRSADGSAGLEAATDQPVMAEYDKLRQEIGRAMADLFNRWSNEEDDTKRRQLRDEFNVLAERQMSVMAAEFRAFLSRPEVRAALAQLKSANAKLEDAIEEMRRARDAIAKTAKVLGFVDEFIGVVRGAFV